MPKYEVDYRATDIMYGTVPMNADDADDAEMKALELIKVDYPEYTDIEVEAVRELNGV